MPTFKRIRITEEKLLAWTRIVPIGELRQHPDNPHNGDVERIQTSIKVHGIFRSVVVSEDLVILAGNHTYQGALGEGKTAMVCHVLPIAHDHPQAIEIMLADNGAYEGSSNDAVTVLELLSRVESQMGTLEGALYSAGRRDRLVEALSRREAGPLTTPAAAPETAADPQSAAPDFTPASLDEQGKLDEKSPIECPNCGHHFRPK
jgi:ParB-like chromosome segregation protein Spo0J